MRLRPDPSKVVVITGASSGFGLLTAVEVAQRGHVVYATMRDLQRGADLAAACNAKQVAVQQRPLDVTKPDSIDTLVAEVIDSHGRIDVLVNNAGVGTVGFAGDLDDDDVRHHLETNFLGAVRCTRAVTAIMRSKGRGTIINVSSIAGRSGVPLLSAYSASKFALEGWSECLRYELAGAGIRVCLIEPGTFRTRMYDEPQSFHGAPESDKPRLREVQTAFTEHARHHGGDPVAVARKIADVVDRWRRFRVVVGGDARWELALKKALPDEAFGRAMHRFVWRRWLDDRPR